MEITSMIFSEHLRARKYRKRPLVIEAVQMPVDFEIDSEEGKMSGKEGDYVIRGIQGEVYSCKKEIFQASYDEVIG